VRISTIEHRAAAEVVVEKLNVESGAHKDDLEGLQTRKKFTQHNQQEVTEPVSFMYLILTNMTIAQTWQRIRNLLTHSLHKTDQADNLLHAEDTAASYRQHRTGTE